MEEKESKPETSNVVSTPITILWDGVLMVPIVGILDSRRTQDMMDTMLDKITSTGATTIILDILGVAMVDSAVANHLIKITKATKIMGCTCIITGISSSVAQALVHLGIDLGDVITRATLKDGLKSALDILGLEVSKAQKRK